MNKTFEFKAVVADYKNQFRDEGFGAHRFLGCTLTLEIDKMWPGGNGTFVGTLTLPEPEPPVCPFCGKPPGRIAYTQGEPYLYCRTKGCPIEDREIIPELWNKRA